MSEKIKEIRKALSKSKLNDKTKKLKPSEKLEQEIKKQEKELSLIKNLLNNKEIRDVEISKLAKKTNKTSSLKPLSRESIKPPNNPNLKEKSLITQITEKTDQSNLRDKEDNSWKNSKSNLDDYQFRRTLTKKNEKVELDCEKSMMKDETSDKPGFIIDNKINTVIEDLVKSEYSELITFLESIEMMKYFDTFQKNCLDDLLLIKEIQETHLDEMQIKKDDREVIMNRINQLIKEEEDFYNSYHDKNTTKEANNNMYDILPDQTIEDEFDKDDEQESFRKAIEEFGDRIKSSKRSKETEVNNETQKKENFNLIQEKENINEKSSLNMSTMEAFENSEGIMKYFLPLNSRKSCCWICFKLITKENIIKSDQIKEKYFCSEKCLEKYFNENFVKCNTYSCQIYLEKTIGIEYCNICIEGKKTSLEEDKSKELQVQKAIEIGDVNVECGNEYDPMKDF